jgi:uncharacterized membrane protein
LNQEEKYDTLGYMNENIIHALDIFALFVGFVGILIILTGVVRGLRDFIGLEMGSRVRHISHNKIRYELGIYLLLGLEFLVAADILETVFKPSLEQLAILGGIVIIRSALNYFLDKELSHIKDEIS